MRLDETIVVVCETQKRTFVQQTIEHSEPRVSSRSSKRKVIVPFLVSRDDEREIFLFVDFCTESKKNSSCLNQVRQVASA